MPNEDRELTRIAYHEAGHAAMVLILGGSLWKVTIIPSELFSAETDATMFSPSASVLVALGGDACERLRFRRKATGATGDYGFVRSKGLSEVEIAKSLCVVKSLLKLHWSGVVALAAELRKSKTLIGSEARAAFTVQK